MCCETMRLTKNVLRNLRLTFHSFHFGVFKYCKICKKLCLQISKVNAIDNQPHNQIL